MFNQTVLQGKIPTDWKNAVITMIPKKSKELENPKNYHLKSITSCLSKLCERLILARINSHLKKEKIIIKQQSGFPAHRQTKDNLIFMIQKIKESFVRN